MKEKDEYRVCIWGITVSKHEAKKIGITIVIGFIGAVLSYIVFGAQNKLTVFIISFVLVAFGYFGVANKVFEKKTNNN